MWSHWKETTFYDHLEKDDLRKVYLNGEIPGYSRYSDINDRYLVCCNCGTNRPIYEEDAKIYQPCECGHYFQGILSSDFGHQCSRITRFDYYTRDKDGSEGWPLHISQIKESRFKRNGLKCDLNTYYKLAARICLQCYLITYSGTGHAPAMCARGHWCDAESSILIDEFEMYDFENADSTTELIHIDVVWKRIDEEDEAAQNAAMRMKESVPTLQMWNEQMLESGSQNYEQHLYHQPAQRKWWQWW